MREYRVWRTVKRRDGVTEPITLWQHQADRLRRREDDRRPVQDKTAIRREIAATVARSTKRQLKEMARARHAVEAPKPYTCLASPATAPPAKPDPDRSRRIFPVEEW
jgi:putative transposase